MKERMIFFEKEYHFNNVMYEKTFFSKEEINALANNPHLNKMFTVMEMEISVNKFKDFFSCMISNIIYQQVAFKVARYSEVMLFDYLDFDITPESILKLSDKQLKKFKIAGRRVEYMRNFAEFVMKNKEFCSNINNLSEDEIYNTLIKIPGIGSWSIEMLFVFGITRKDILSLKDLIIVRGLNKLYGDVDLKSVREDILPYGTITSINLWKFVEKKYCDKL